MVTVKCSECDAMVKVQYDPEIAPLTEFKANLVAFCPACTARLKEDYAVAMRSHACDGNPELCPCKGPIEYLDNKGYLYCTQHGKIMRQTRGLCRKLTHAELERLKAGARPYRQRK